MKVLMIFAHPDDETFGLGGLTKKLTRNGNKVVLITATKGEKGMIGYPPITTQENLGKVREKELKRASKITGIKKIYFLGYIDGTLENISKKELAEKIYNLIIKEKPDIVITFDETGISNHPDHKTISFTATQAFYAYMNNSKKHVKLYHTAFPKSNIKKLAGSSEEYKAFGKMKGTPDELITTKIDISQEFKFKERAMMEHKTQKKDWERILKRGKIINHNTEYLRLIAENNIF